MTNDIKNEILKLKKEKNAVILAHFYQIQSVQEIADHIGDSLELARLALASNAKRLVFCGVDFMAESAKLLNPEKKVLLPFAGATCPMANMVTAKDVKMLRGQYPDAAVVTYINSSTEVKAESDICCTSANAIKIVNSLPQKEIIFLPDKNLGSYVARFTDKKIILFNGFCPVHDKMTVKDVQTAREKHPNALLAVHPECPACVVDAADFCGSTSQIIKYVASSATREFIIGTEQGVIGVLEKENRDKLFYPLTDDFICENMKKTLLTDVLNSLEKDIYAVEIEDEIISKASASLKRMLECK